MRNDWTFCMVDQDVLTVKSADKLVTYQVSKEKGHIEIMAIRAKYWWAVMFYGDKGTFKASVTGESAGHSLISPLDAWRFFPTIRTANRPGLSRLFSFPNLAELITHLCS